MAILTQTYEGVPEGVNLAVPPHEIKDTQARYIQDGFLDQIGLLRGRGSLQAATLVAQIANAASGIVQAITPAGTHKVGVLHGSAAAKLAVLSDDYTTSTDVDWSGTLPSSPYYLTDAKPALGGGTLIGTSSQLNKNGAGVVQRLGLWRGADKPTYSTGTITVVRGATSVTGSGTSWTANVKPGMFLFATADSPAATTVYLGYVTQVTSDTALTLANPAPYAVTARAYSLKPVRGLGRRYTGGRITTQTTSTAAVGADSKWKDNGLDSGTWDIFRAVDRAFIGRVASVQGNTGLTLAANAAIAMDNDTYVAFKAESTYDLDTTTNGLPIGFINATFAERQFYAAGDTLWFTETDELEGLDISATDGNFIPVTNGAIGAVSTDIVALAPSYDSLLVAKQNETWALAGTTPTQFTLRKLADDGALSPMSVQTYEGGVIFAGRDGIYAYNGTQLTNVVQATLGTFYKNLVKTFDPTSKRMWSMLAGDTYFLFIENVTPTYTPRKGRAIANVTRTTISIYLPSQAVTFHTNLDIRGAINLPSATGKGTWFLVNASDGKAYICSANALLAGDGIDVLTCVGNTAGPDFYMESKRYDLGDGLLKKLFKQVMLHYWVGGDNLLLDTVVGLNEEGTTSLSQWAKTVLAWGDVPAIANTWDNLATQYATWDDLGEQRFAIKRIKFLKRSQHLGFRIYQKSNSVNSVKLGPWALGFKPQRAGRI